jgi:creatinine amidohydrolase
MDLADATWTEVADADTRLALLPVGSTEQHGPHAPLGTDTHTAEAVARAGADRYAEREGGADAPGGRPVVAPPIPVGVAEEHRAFAGTLWVSPDTFRAYVRETARSLASHGFDRLVVVNGHGGNVDALREVTARLTRDGDLRAVPFTWFDHVDRASAADGDATAPAVPPMGHGGGRETALLRAIAPELVREERVEAAREGAADRWGDWVEGVNLAYDTEAFSANGVVGDPSEGDAATGERLLDAAAAALAALLAALVERGA